MSELAEIIAAFDALCVEGKSAALATVIAVEGSAYRRPGARMLVAEDGRSWGGVSGGCLERDVARRGRGVIVTNRAVICKYDEDDGISATGCGGVVTILIQPISQNSRGPMPAIKDAVLNRREIYIATMIRDGDHSMPLGDCIVQARPSGPGDFLDGPDLKVRLGDFFIETISPPQALIIFGEGPDAVPLVAIAKTLGWHVMVVTTRPAASRFAQADRIHVTPAANPLDRIEIGADSAVVVMTHNLARDEKIMSLLPQPLRYLGLLGPRHRTQMILENISREPLNLFAPVGLDLGAHTPEEIALAIVAEIQAVIRDANGGSLRDQIGPIHQRAVETTDAKDWSSTCPA
jgi:xanthine dehydrogenase accessory factor